MSSSTLAWETTSRFWGIGNSYADKSGTELTGGSWGGMLAREYVVARQPAGMRRLVLADTLASMETYIEGINELLRDLPQELLDAISKNEAAGTFGDPEYQKACSVFYKKHMCKLDPWPKELAEGMRMLSRISLERVVTFRTQASLLWRRTKVSICPCSCHRIYRPPMMAYENPGKDPLSSLSPAR